MKAADIQVGETYLSHTGEVLKITEGPFKKGYGSRENHYKVQAYDRFRGEWYAAGTSTSRELLKPFTLEEQQIQKAERESSWGRAEQAWRRYSNAAKRLKPDEQYRVHLLQDVEMVTLRGDIPSIGLTHSVTVESPLDDLAYTAEVVISIPLQAFEDLTAHPVN